jgi:purine-nucleoside phosphorylase
MLRDLTKSDWLSILGLSEDRVPKVLILRGTRNLKRNYEKYHKYFVDITEVCSPNSLFEDIFVADFAGIPIAYASVYGPAMTSEVVHVFAVLGTHLVLQTGCCGALTPDILTGDLFIPTEAYCGDGASDYYRNPRDKIVKASFNISQHLPTRQADGPQLHLGRIYTTSALLAEGKQQLEDWFNKGCLAADMETATAFAVAEYFGMDSASILYVFDNPRYEADITESELAKDKKRTLAEQQMINLTFQTIKAYCK